MPPAQRRELFELAHAFAAEAAARAAPPGARPPRLDPDRLMSAFARAYRQIRDEEEGIV